MNIHTQRQLARMMRPTEEGADLGGSATEAAIDAIGAQEAEPIVEATPEPEATQPDGEAPKPGARMAAMLDELSGDAPKPEEPKPDQEKPADHVADAGKKVEDAPKAPEQEEAELLEGVKSERGKERIKQVFTEKKQLEKDVGEFRQLVQSTGMSPQEFAQTLEFGRLMNSGDEKNLRVALEMIEGQRAVLYQKLGVEAPGIDLLKDHADLKQAVEGMEITRDRAVELAKYRRQQDEVTQRQQAEQQSAQSQQQFHAQVQQASGAMEQYLETRRSEVDHPARMKVITEHFKNPANLQQFVSTYEPKQWAATVKMMYDNIQVPRAAASPQPIRSRPASLGVASASGQTPIDRIASRMDAMGL